MARAEYRTAGESSFVFVRAFSYHQHGLVPVSAAERAPLTASSLLAAAATVPLAGARVSALEREEGQAGGGSEAGVSAPGPCT